MTTPVNAQIRICWNFSNRPTSVSKFPSSSLVMGLFGGSVVSQPTSRLDSAGLRSRFVSKWVRRRVAVSVRRSLGRPHGRRSHVRRPWLLRPPRQAALSCTPRAIKARGAFFVAAKVGAVNHCFTRRNAVRLQSTNCARTKLREGPDRGEPRTGYQETLRQLRR
jgi:hypothetical protein